MLAAAGIASRRKCEELIREGRVDVDGQTVSELGTRVDPLKQEIRVDGEALPRPKLTYLAINKPTGVVSTARDPAGRPRVTDLLPPNIPRVFCVGRLDMERVRVIGYQSEGAMCGAVELIPAGGERGRVLDAAVSVEQAWQERGIATQAFPRGDI